MRSHHLEGNDNEPRPFQGEHEVITSPSSSQESSPNRETVSWGCQKSLEEKRNSQVGSRVSFSENWLYDLIAPGTFEAQNGKMHTCNWTSACNGLVWKLSKRELHPRLSICRKALPATVNYCECAALFHILFEIANSTDSHVFLGLQTISGFVL